MTFHKTAVFLLAVLLSGCQAAPVPPEVRQAERQEQDLRGAGASLYAGQEYALYLQSLKAARRILDREGLKLGWFRAYGRARQSYEAVLRDGEQLRAKVQALKEQKASAFAASAAGIRRKLQTLDGLTLSLVERGNARKLLTRASVLLAEAEFLMAQAQFEAAMSKIESVSALAAEAEKTIVSNIARYLDPKQIQVWKKAADETVDASRKKKLTVLIVSKLERRLAVYKNGALIRTFSIGLGFNGLDDKRHSGDDATPEGRYAIVRKNPNSLYHKALLINYPNEEDRRWFAQEKAKGNIPRNVGIGGDVEIHGGGEDSLTRGCVSLDNRDMDELYGLVMVGTPVTIVGTMELENYVIKALGDR